MRSVDKKRRLAFYKSLSWQKKRKEIIKRDNNECQLCKSKGHCSPGQTTKLDVHHIKFLENRWDLRLNDNNLITLCVECHNKQHPEKLLETRTDVPPERFE